MFRSIQLSRKTAADLRQLIHQQDAALHIEGRNYRKLECWPTEHLTKLAREQHAALVKVHGLKYCSKCVSYQVPGNFCANDRTKDGLSAICRDCMRTLCANWSTENREYIRMYRQAKYDPAKRQANYQRYKAKK